MATPEQPEVLTITFDGLRPSSRARLLRTVQTLRASGVIAYAIDVKTGLPIPERPGRHFGLYHLPNGHRLALVTPKHLHRYNGTGTPKSVRTATVNSLFIACYDRRRPQPPDEQHFVPAVTEAELRQPDAEPSLTEILMSPTHVVGIETAALLGVTDQLQKSEARVRNIGTSGKALLAGFAVALRTELAEAATIGP